MRKNLGGMGMPDLHIHVQVKTPGGVILEDRWEKGHSWTRNAWCAFNAMMLDTGGSGVAYPAIVNRPGKLGTLAYDSGLEHISGVSSENRALWQNGGAGLAGRGFYNNGVGAATWGIVVGTDVGKGFHPMNWKLNAPVAHGNGAGQLSYTAQSAPVLTYDSDTRKYTNTMTRVLNNNSGGQIDIKELGLVWHGYMHGTNGVWLFAHDILEETVELPDTGQLTVTYAITSQEFTIDADEDAYFAPGTEGSGGYVAGVTKHPTLGIYDPLWLLVVAPVSGGQGASKKYRDPTGEVAGTSTERGWLNSSALSALGANSGIGEFMDAANTAELGGYNDWYIPSQAEMQEICYPNRASLPAGEEWATDAHHWSSSNTDTYRARTVNFADGGINNTVNQTTALNVRLVRRVHITEFVPVE